MGCNTSKETAVATNEKENTDNENKDCTNNEKIVEEVEEHNHIGTDLLAKDTKTSSAKTITIQSNGTANLGGEEEEAATKIQAVFRGHQTRKSMKQPQGQEAEREPTREELENEFRLDDAELCHAATKIQASFRGHMSRKTESDKKGPESSSKEENKEEELDIDLTDPDLNKAAAKIQASFRGHMNRKEDEGKA